jgi:hypothetical protein
MLLGALALVRPEYLGVTVLLAVAVALRGLRGDSRLSSAQAAVMLAAALVVIAPWTIRNANALDRFVPISTGGGQVLFAGTYLPSDGDPEKVGAGVVAHHPGIFDPADARELRLEQILARLAAARHPNLETDQALSRMGRERLWDDISEEPLEYAGFVAAKVSRVWFHPARAVMRSALWVVLQWAAVLATVFLSITAISALLVASPRRALVMLPLLAPLAGVGAAWLWHLGRDRSGPPPCPDSLRP